MNASISQLSSTIRREYARQEAQVSAVEARLANIRQTLNAPTHARCTARGVAVAYIVDDEAQTATAEGWCSTCRAYDVSGEHRRHGHRVD
jgi:hypothetical protein